MLVHHYNQPRAGCRALCRMWSTLCYVVLLRGSGTHWGITSAQLTRQPVPVGLTCSPGSPAHRCSALGMCVFLLWTQKSFPGDSCCCSWARHKESLLPQVCLSKVVVSPFMKAQGPLCLSGMWEPISLKTFLGEGFRVASCSPGELLAEGGVWMWELCTPW